MDNQEISNPSDPNRREFLLTMGSSAAAAVITGCAPLHPEEPHAVVADRSPVQGAAPITLRINGKDHHLRIDPRDRKSTRLNSSHLGISYAVFCLKKKT